MASPLASSVASLRSSLSLLDSSISILSAGTADFPRLRTVLAATRHFELVPSTRLAAAQASLASELAPAIEKLLSRAESEVERMERREKGLIANSELFEGRLEDAHHSRAQRAGSRPSSRMKGGGSEEKTAKLKMLRQKKERLAYAVERLELQSQQRQRELRRSVNVPRLEHD